MYATNDAGNSNRIIKNFVCLPTKSPAQSLFYKQNLVHFIESSSGIIPTASGDDKSVR